MASLYDEAVRAADCIRQRVRCRPEVAVILGSGLGEIGESLEDRELLPYEEIPGFPRSAVSGHAARFLFGNLKGRPVAVMQGRFHFYEGHSMRQVAFPVYVLKLLGVKTLAVTNACGGINAAFAPGDLMLITDHINLTGHNPLIGDNDERFGPRFPDMTEVYDRPLRELTKERAAELAIPLREGVYAFFPGPCYETAAEIRAYRALGADAVGMSTVPEATVAHYLGMGVLGIACITNMATGIAAAPHSHGAVLAAAAAAGDTFRRLLERVLPAVP